GLKQDVGGLKQDVGGLKQDVGGLKHDFAEMAQRVDVTQEDVGWLKRGMRVLLEHQGLTIEPDHADGTDA
ncbi:MAG TPA: hypothetical protein VGX25_28470, partial [Actinophytocola sp.]|uniref:hypothetical protein n=1 Tax=Actinophytocola sp. TaxID=1872138 RepID=UPI002DDD4005